MGQQVTIENRADAGAIIGAEAAARSAGDGYTVFTADNGVLVYNPALYKKLPCNPGRDFAADRADGGLHARGNPQVAQADSRPWHHGGMKEIMVTGCMELRRADSPLRITRA
jgi:hypothetical protein